MKKIILLPICFLVLISSVNAVFNTTGLDNADNIYEFALALDNLTGNVIGLGLLIITFTITYTVVSGRTSDNLAGLGAGSFITGLGAVILLPLGFIGFNVFQVVIAMTAISVAVTILLR